MKSWGEAHQHCKDEAQPSDGNLVSIPDRETEEFLARMSENQNFIFWTGARSENSVWTWKDGTPWNYINWFDGYPDHLTCMIYHGKTGQWKTKPCLSLRPFICQYSNA